MSKVNHEVLDGMMQVEEEEEELNLVKEEFETVLIEKFQELERLKEEEMNGTEMRVEPEASKSQNLNHEKKKR